MKKLLFAIAMICSVMTATAQRAGDATAWNEYKAEKTDYNRISVSYDLQHFGFNKEYTGDDSEGRNLNGFGINYTHGFGVAENMFVETGLSFSLGFGTEAIGEKHSYDGYYYQAKEKMNNINMRIPVNFVYRFDINDKFSVAPFIGLNFKLNLISRYKDFLDTNDSDYDADEEEWVNLYSDSEDNMDGKDYTWNRFQMGWQIGATFEFSKFAVGLQYGTDFIPAYSHNFDGYKPKVSSSLFALSVGYTF